MALKKQWYEIVSPKMFGERVVGETPAVDAKQLVGRKIQTSIVEVSRDFSRFFVKLNFQITDVSGTKAFTKLIGHDVMSERIYRMVQRYVRRVDVIQDVTTKDGVKLRVKTVFTLARRVNTALKVASRSVARDFIDKAAKSSNFEDFMQSVIKGDVQHRLRKECSKIYPVANVEIRRTEVLG